MNRGQASVGSPGSISTEGLVTKTPGLVTKTPLLLS